MEPAGDGVSSTRRVRHGRRAQLALVTSPVAMIGWLVGAVATGPVQYVAQAIFLAGIVGGGLLGARVWGQRARVLALEAGWPQLSVSALQGVTIAAFLVGMAVLGFRLLG